MQIGKLNRQVFIEKPTGTEDPQGGSVLGWVAVVPEDDGLLWANVRFLNGTEALKSDGALSMTKASIRIRFRDDVDATCRVTYEGTQFEILAVLPDGAGREYVDLAVQSGANDG